MKTLRNSKKNKKEVKKTEKKVAESLDPELIIDYYKNWDSDNAPVIMVLDSCVDLRSELEIEDQKKFAKIRQKYSKK